MPLEVVSKVEKRLQAVARRRSGMSLREVADWAGVHPATVRRWVVGFEAGGGEALAERSRRPLRSPGRLPTGLEDQIVALRHDEDLCRFGVPGAGLIRETLRRQGWPVPARSTVHAVLVRRGEIQPRAGAAKLPPIRFEAPRPNELWQLDGFDWTLTDQTPVEVIDVLDDHARKLLAMVAVAVIDTTAALAAFHRAVEAEGAPAGTLCDNAGYFTGRAHGAVSEFERTLWDLGVATRHGAPYHPQTQGKIERFHRTAKNYLRRLPPAGTLVELQAQLDRLVKAYNNRPHQGIDYATPNERYMATAKATSRGAETTRDTTRKVWDSGNIRYSRWVINLGRAHRGTEVLITDNGTKIQVSHPDGTHLTTFTADTPKGYVPR
jgi:transposase InsO family protein